MEKISMNLCLMVAALMFFAPVAKPVMASDLSLPIEFDYQLLSKSAGDWIRVVFIVNATNVGTEPIDACFEFEFSCTFNWNPDKDSLSSNADEHCSDFTLVSQAMESPLFRNESKPFLPGQVLSDTLSFRYSPKQFESCSGEIEIKAELLCGRPGSRKDEANRIGGDRLCFSIPIGMEQVCRLSKDPSRIKYPEVISFERPIYPEIAKTAKLSAEIIVLTVVGKDGKPIKTEILSREPEGAYIFDEAARRCAMSFRFSPALNELGEPLVCTIAIPIRFNLEGFTPPVCDFLPEPKYPRKARELGLEGWIALAVLVDENGKAKQNHIHIVGREHPETDIFDEAAKEVAKNAHFMPAFDDGVPTVGWAFIKVEFKLTDHRR